MYRRTCRGRRGAAYALSLGLGVLACHARDERPPLDPAVVRLGRTVYEARCASCHGARGAVTWNWKRPDARGDYPPPPHDSTGHTWHHADGLLYRIVATGVTDTTSRRPSRMPAFGDTLSDVEIRAVLTYVKTLWTPAQRRRQWEATREDPFPATREGPRR